MVSIRRQNEKLRLQPHRDQGVLCNFRKENVGVGYSIVSELRDLATQKPARCLQFCVLSLNWRDRRALPSGQCAVRRYCEFSETGQPPRTNLRHRVTAEFESPG